MRTALVLFFAALISGCASIILQATDPPTQLAPSAPTLSPVVIYVTPAPSPIASAAPTATVAPTPMPTVAPVAGTRENPYPLGTEVTVGDYRVAVRSVTPDAWSQIREANMFNDPPDAGFQFVMFEASVTYVGSDKGTPWLDLSWAVIGSRGNAFEEGLDYSCGVLPNDMISVGDLYNGATARGNVCVAVESSQFDGAAIRLQEGFFPSNEVFFAASGQGVVPSSDPLGGLTPGYVAFTVQQLQWLDTMQADVDAISAAGDPWSPRKLRPAVSTALQNTLDIQSWLATNPPDSACYADLHRAWTDYADAYVSGLDTVNYGLIPPITYSDVDDGLQQLIDAAALLDDVSSAMDATTCI